LIHELFRNAFKSKLNDLASRQSFNTNEVLKMAKKKKEQIEQQ